jgi:hypothetical protein
MEGSKKFVVRLVIALVLIFGGGWFVGGTLNLAALVSPSLVSKMECQPGSTAQKDFKQQSFDQPGQKTLTFTCVDSSGKTVPPLKNDETQAMEFKTFYPAGVVLMALIVAAWFIGSAIRGRMKAKTA